MNKVICDVCGTDYPETAAQCPICGCARTDGNQTSAGNTETGEEERTHTYVKGGRFSKSNVRKRLKAAQVAQTRVPEPEYDDDDEDEDDEDEEVEEGRSNFGLIAIVILLLLAIIAVSSYIAIVHFGLFDQADPTKPSISNTQPTGTKPSTSDTLKIPCTSLTMSDSEITLASVDSVWPLNYSVEPLDTTDEIIFVSADESVAVVDASGRVTAVGSGETTITATCGSFVVECRVICDFETENTTPTDPDDITDPTDPVDPSEPDDETYSIRFNGQTSRWGNDTTIKAGSSFNLTLVNSKNEAMDVLWTVDDETICSVNGKVVKGLSKGNATLTTTYNGQVYSCVVRVQGGVDVTTPTEPIEPSDTTEPAEVYTFRINGAAREVNEDITVDIGETVTFTIENSMGANMQVEWTASEEGICTIDGKKITGVAKGNVTVSTTYEGQTYTCVIRVKDPTA